MDETHYQQYGTTWVSADGTKRRIFFPESLLADLIGFRYETYKTGNIQSAGLGGKKLSNGKADQLRTTLRFGKAYFDCVSGELKAENLGSHTDTILHGLRHLGQ